MKIYGGGLAGLLAGCLFPDADIYEAGPDSQVNHKAVLRFRTSAVGDAVGIDFRRVRVHKGIWIDDGFVAPTIRLANWYSQKVIGRLADRSIWNLDPVDRFIAPENLIEQLADRCRNRIFWDRHINAADFVPNSGEAAVSTLPMQLACQFAGEINHPTFTSSPITVHRWRVPNADVFQTVYFPQPYTSLYRASITGDILTAEYAAAEEGDVEDCQPPLVKAFGLSSCFCQSLDTSSQRYGKIAPIDDAWRKQFIFNLTHKYNVFSLGRFGTWRNILMDDVLKDIVVLKKMMKATAYDRRKVSA